MNHQSRIQKTKRILWNSSILETHCGRGERILPAAAGPAFVALLETAFLTAFFSDPDSEELDSLELEDDEDEDADSLSA